MTDEQQGLWSRLWQRPTKKWMLGIPVGAVLAFVLGGIALGTTNYVLHETSTTEFCYVCHSHDAFIRPEYEASTHFVNTSGVRASCADCHLPHDNWFELVWTKTVVSFDIIPEVMGKLDTAEKYESHRAEMAEIVWRQFKENDSRFCRGCHVDDAMNLELQDRRAARRHAQAAEKGETCIDCHYGIVHALPENSEAILDQINEEITAAAGD